ncbi:MAG TPA: ATP-binding protein [Polyangiales bacterium]|nr:ATP-binding protein [Polyangiales bacterium]
MDEAKAADVAYAEIANLEDLIDRDSLREVCRSFYDLFGLSIRVFSARGVLLANVHEERSICRYVNSLPSGRVACSETVTHAQQLVPSGDATATHRCFTGAAYDVLPILYDGRQLGRIVIGPFLPSDVNEVPQTLLRVDARLEPERARLALAEMPRVRKETAQRIATHLRGVLDLILFSGHRAQLTSAMHLLTVRENYRELAEKNTRLQDAFDKLKELDRLKSNFLATVSHELRTPLTSIIGYSEMLEAGIAGELTPEQGGFVETIRTKGELLLQLISSLLDLNKLERGQLKIKPEYIDPRALVMEVKETCLPEAEKRHVKLELQWDSDLPMVQADAIRMRQILINLLSNAIKFSKDNGKVLLRVRNSELRMSDEMFDEEDADGDFGAALMMAPERAVEFSVQDFGIGIPDNELEKIFDAFYQVDGSSTREYGGAGLGLSIAKSLVSAHHGQIRVESVLGNGTTFFVTIPETQPDAV